MPALVRGWLVVFGGSTEDMVEQYFYWCFMVSIGVVGRFVTIVKMVKRGDITGIFVLFKILVSSITLHSALGKNDSKHGISK